jgi:hypothetical protein
MKKLLLFLICVLFSMLICLGQETNDFFDNTQSKKLAGSLKIEVMGEVANPGPIDLGRLPIRSLIVRETRLEKDKIVFIGAYRYEGYSLLDILNDRTVAKKNAAEFRPLTDLLVAVENQKGEKVVLSWGEIYYPAALHRIMVAGYAAPIIPSETKENWPLADNVKLVCGNDMVSERNIENPSKITIFSAPLSFPGRKGLKPLYAPGFQVISNNSETAVFNVAQADAEKRIYPSVFYGRGKGFHGINYFSGILLKDALRNFFTVNRASLQRGYVLAAAIDGYRVAISCSELFNRNDQAEFLLLDRGENQDGGRYALFPAADFFSDRALKAVNAIHFLTY